MRSFESRARPSWRNALMTLPWLLGLLLLTHRACVAREVAAHEDSTWGTVTEHHPRNHSEYCYAFSVAGRDYNGCTVPVGSDKWQVGQRVVVYYDARRPSKSSLRRFSEQRANALGPVPFLIAGILGVLGFIAYRRRIAAG